MTTEANSAVPPITLGEGVNYSDLKLAHEGIIGDEEALYPQETAQNDALRAMKDRLNSSTNMKELGNATDLIADVASDMKVPERDKTSLREVKDKVVEIITKIEDIKNEKSDSPLYRDAVLLADDALYENDKTPSQIALIEAVVDRVSLGQEADKLESFVSTLRFTAARGGSEKSKRHATECIQRILETNTATSKIKIDALGAFQDISPENFDQRSADILISVINAEPEEGNDQQAEYIAKSRKIAIAVADNLLFERDLPEPAISLLTEVIRLIDKDNKNIPSSTISNFGFIAERGLSDRIKKLASTPFRNFLEGKSKNQVIARMPREVVASLAYPI